jgi:NitT/TauT family transport system permease protein
MQSGVMIAMRQTMMKRARPWLLTIALFVAWELGCRLSHVPSFVLPAPSEIFKAAIQFREPLLMHGLQTLLTTMAGFAVAIVVGILLGVAVGSSAAVYETLYPLLVGFNAVPKVALVPVVVIWCGIGTVPAIITAFVISFFPITVNVATGLASVEPELQDVLRVLGASSLDVLRKVGIPRSMPYLFASLKVAVTLAFIGSVVSETVAANQGIGFLMLAASSRFQIALVFAALLLVATMSIVLYAFCALLERRMAGWAFRGQTN